MTDANSLFSNPSPTDEGRDEETCTSEEKNFRENEPFFFDLLMALGVICGLKLPSYKTSHNSH
jgi:hypothetical protein